MRARFSRQDGFSLAETALSLSILALVIGALIPGLLSARAAEQDRLTRARLETLMRAVSGFVQANGCFPCPTPFSAQNTAGRGLVRGDSENPAVCNSCPSAIGLVPFRSLGVPESFARDGYARWFTMAVDVALTTADVAKMPPTAICKSGDTDPPCSPDDITNTRQKGLCKTGLPTEGRLSVFTKGGIGQQAAIVILSHGANGYGAFTEGGTEAPAHFPFPDNEACSPGNSGGEHCNADDNLVFVASQPVALDDQMLYFDRNALIAMSGNGTCKAPW